MSALLMKFIMDLQNGSINPKDLTRQAIGYPKAAQTHENPQDPQSVPGQTEYSKETDVFEGEAIQDKPLYEIQNITQHKGESKMNHNINTMSSNNSAEHLFTADENPLTISSLRLAKMIEDKGGLMDQHEVIKRTIEKIASYQRITFSRTMEVFDTGIEETIYHISEEDSYIVMDEYFPIFSVLLLVDEWKEIKEENLKLTDPTTNNKAMMSSLEIAELAGKQHKNVMRDIRSLIDQGVIDGLNFELVKYRDAKGELRDAYSLDFDATMVLVTGYDAHRRMAIIKRWRELESGKAQPAMVDFNAVNDLRDLLNSAIERENKYLKKIQKDAPKVAYVDDVVLQTEGLMTLGDYGRILKNREKLPTGQKKIYSQLRRAGIIMKSKSLPYNKYIDRGYFVISLVFAGEKMVPQTYVTAKGQIWVHQKLKEYLSSTQ